MFVILFTYNNYIFPVDFHSFSPSNLQFSYEKKKILYIIIIIFFYSKPPAAQEAASRGLNTMIQLNITVNNKCLTMYGFGHNKKKAKIAAAKMALKSVKKLLTP